MIHKSIVKRHFNRHAHEYDEYAEIQKHMAIELLGEIVGLWRNGKTPHEIVEIGCGTGSLTSELIRQFPKSHFTTVDLSERMIAMTHSRLGPSARRVRFIEGDAEDFGLLRESLKQPVDLIISNATFQWFNRPAQAVREYVKMLADHGVLAFSSFGPETFRELHASFGQAEDELGIPRQRHGQSFVSREEWLSCFSRLPFYSEHSRPNVASAPYLDWREEHVQLEYPKVRDFLDAVKRVGAGDAEADEKTGGRKLLYKMMDCYEQNFQGKNGGIRATYHLQFGVFQKGKSGL